MYDLITSELLRGRPKCKGAYSVDRLYEADDTSADPVCMLHAGSSLLYADYYLHPKTLTQLAEERLQQNRRLAVLVEGQCISKSLADVPLRPSTAKR
jgi:hypothetical protein